jgi:glycogen debranching enzyme
MSLSMPLSPTFTVVEAKGFVNAESVPLPEWPCVLSEHQHTVLTLKDDDLFLLSDTLGNIAGCMEDDHSASMGLFCKDTRFLSRLDLQIDRRSPILLSSTADKGFALSVLCTNPTLDNLRAESIGIKRELVLNGALFEEIELTNYSTQAVQFELSLSFNADFVDLFEIRGFDREQSGQLLRLPQQPKDTLNLAYRGHDGGVMESVITFDPTPPTSWSGNTALWQLSLEPRAALKLGYRLQMLLNGKNLCNVNPSATLGQAKAAETMEEEQWRQRSTQIRSDKNTFNQIIHRAEQDIYLLRQSFGQGTVLSAGVPWFSTLFGRDSIIAASQVLMLDPQIAKETLMILAHYQGKNEDPWRDEEPGKILHEIRFGELARCQSIPHTPYYGTVDATPLWLMLYADYFAWTNDRETIESLWDNAIAAMGWIDRTMQHTSYLSYFRKSGKGLDNQGWKDSGDCILNREGHLAQGSIALCEVQGYVYAAKLRMAQLARQKQQTELANQWETDARELKIRFNRDFWVEDQGYCAVALDGDHQPVDSITSNPGHCLALDIFTPEKAYSVAERLRAPDMFSGWGIRTLSSLSPAYNPMGYHIGSVWPHDNALTAMGLRSLGLIDQALELAEGLLSMTQRQPYQRPPELFCGFERQPGNDPVRYPVACTPQAWATGSIFQLLQMMANLVPDAPNNTLRIIDPTLPPSITSLQLTNLRIGPTLLDLELERSGTSTACHVSKKRGNLRVIIEA